ncbi:ParB/RepB/Spo0J family partition protein [Anaerococcus degeneri]|uniref:ParB/RepB/Spo0J family partition protein n=1 Tax=Anaerococcus degeneri TaxID=361500 RepID=A0ABS7YX12_9FIRM|nr:ParB/RepB/Spo0J family partition protein [Anaerococcus degeneri]MBP2015386.1 ParB family chromosome partitioning protein [Anaerococcus degeneri]MCA2096280.1 ParB/RepB/Spo0J family partition protein [Anaerococcus degeneri]
MTNRRSLGRGLGSLIPNIKEEVKEEILDEKTEELSRPENISQENAPDINGETREENLKFTKIQSLAIEKIRPRQGQPRTDFDEKSLEDLANSIKEYGLLNPITVTKVSDHYEILAGERRYRASLLNKEETIDAIVKDYEEKDVEVLSLIENVQREDLSAIEEATAYKKLADNFCLTQDEIAQKMGKSRSYIANTIRLLKLNEEEKSALSQGTISPSQARSLLSLSDEDKRAQALDDYINKKAVVRDVEKISREEKDTPRKNFIDLSGKKEIETKKAEKNQEKKEKSEKLPNLDSLLFDDFEEKFMDKLATKVAIEKSKDAYKVVIDCFSIEDIEKIYDRISYED